MAFVRSDTVDESSALWVITTTGGAEPRELFTVPHETVNVPGADTRLGALRQPAWSPDGRHLLFARLGPADGRPGFELWRISVDGGEPESLGLRMDGLFPTGLNVHPNGRSLALTAGKPRSQETWVIRNLLPPAEDPAASEDSR